jgi:hypothetical protein
MRTRKSCVVQIPAKLPRATTLKHQMRSYDGFNVIPQGVVSGFIYSVLVSMMLKSCQGIGFVMNEKI